MRRFLAVSIVISTFTIISTGASASVKAGTACSPKGKTTTFGGYRYTCVLSGKKTIWNKGVKVTPTTTTTSTTTTTLAIQAPKTFEALIGNSTGIALGAWNSFSEKSARSEITSVVQSIYVGPHSTLLNSNVSQVFKDATKLFAGFTQPKSFLSIYYNYQDVDWAKAKLIELGQSRSREIDGSCATSTKCNGASAGLASDTTGFSQFGIPGPTENKDTYHLGGGLEIHEYTHMVQWIQFIGKPTAYQVTALLPQWFIEGHAHVVGILGSTKTLTEYVNNRKDWLNTRPNAAIQSFSSENIERFYAELMPGKYNTELFEYVYTLGYLTLECLVALKGIDSPMQLIVEESNGMSFETAFKKIYGVDWKFASPLLAKAVSQQFAN